MDTHDDENNVFVNEEIWIKWVLWYGVDRGHTLDRRNTSSVEREFEVCVLSPYSGQVENPTKVLDVSDQTGYIELQMRTIFQVAEHRKTRLWACEKARCARFSLVLDRNVEFGFQESLDLNQEYMLAIEVCNTDGSWPTYVPGEPIGGLDKYAALTSSPKTLQYWEKELADTISEVFTNISSDLKETADGIITSTKCITAHKEAEITKCKQDVQKKMEQAEKLHRSLDDKKSKIHRDEEVIRSEKHKLNEERRSHEQERKRLQVPFKTITYKHVGPTLNLAATFTNLCLTQ
jgi:hypothetical protein